MAQGHGAASAAQLLHKALLNVQSASPRLIHTPVVPPNLGASAGVRQASVAVSEF